MVSPVSIIVTIAALLFCGTGAVEVVENQPWLTRYSHVLSDSKGEFHAPNFFDCVYLLVISAACIGYVALAAKDCNVDINNECCDRWCGTSTAAIGANAFVVGVTSLCLVRWPARDAFRADIASRSSLALQMGT